MRRTSTLVGLIVFGLLLVLAVNADGQERRRPAAPMLTNDDVLSPGTARSTPEESVSRTSLSGSPLPNPRAVLESALARMAEVRSVRTRLQSVLANGRTELLIESVKPDRLHVIAPNAEMIAIGRKFYVKSGGQWVLQPVAPGGEQFNAVLDFRTFLKEMGGKLSGVRITGEVLGSQMMDGVETVAYEFTVTDKSDSGTVRVSIGKDDGYVRHMALSGAGLDFKMWFTNINEQISIEPPK